VIKYFFYLKGKSEGLQQMKWAFYQPTISFRSQ